MNACDRRTVIAEVPRDLASILDLRDDSMRLAYFDQSRRTVAGRLAPFRYEIETTHESQHDRTDHN